MSFSVGKCPSGWLTPYSAKVSDRCEDVKEFYDFLHNKKIIKFHAHPTKSNPEKYPAFELVLSSKISYDTLSQKAAEQLKVPPTHIRFFTVNAATGNPKVPVKRGATQTLQSILSPAGYTQMNAQRSDAFYFEVLDIPLSELDTKKAIKVNLLSEGITKEVSCYLDSGERTKPKTDGSSQETFDVLVAKNGNIGDMIQVLIMKANLEDEGEAGRLRIYEVSQHKVYRELGREYPVISLNDFTTLYAERVPEEEVNADEAHFIKVFHFQNDLNRAHGVPFRFLLKEVCSHARSSLPQVVLTLF